MSGAAKALELGPVSIRLRSRAVLSLCAMCLALCALIALALVSGAFPVGPGGVLWALAGQGDAVTQMIVTDHRLPRLLAGAGVGAAFGLSGAIFQALMRNPLAAPDIVGFGAGATCGALAAVVLAGGGVMILPGALAGGVLAALLVLGLSWDGGLRPLRVVLTGIGISVTLSALADFMMARLDVMTAADLTKWMAGTLNTRGWSEVRLVWGGLTMLVPLALWQSFALTRLEMPDDVAAGLGIAITPARLAAAGCSVALIALAVSVAGPLPFVAFVSGPIARRLGGGGGPALLGAAFVGALVTLAADLAARTALGGLHLPTGVFTGMIGAPFLLWLLAAEFRKG